MTTIVIRTAGYQSECITVYWARDTVRDDFQACQGSSRQWVESRQPGLEGRYSVWLLRMATPKFDNAHLLREAVPRQDCLTSTVSSKKAQK
jgi:hypothetical protein